MLGCPNLSPALCGAPARGGGDAPISRARDGGVVVVAARGCGAWLLPLSADAAAGARAWRELRVSAVGGDRDRDPERRAPRLVEGVERGHSNHEWSEAATARLGAGARAPARLDSQAKAALLASGAADVLLRLPPAGYREKIWDVVSGALLLSEAGGRVTDTEGREIDFSQGAYLDAISGVVASNGAVHDELLEALQQAEAAV